MISALLFFLLCDISVQVLLRKISGGSYETVSNFENIKCVLTFYGVLQNYCADHSKSSA